MVSSKVHEKFGGSHVSKGTAKFLSTVSYPASCYAFWTGFGVGAKISEALSAEP